MTQLYDSFLFPVTFFDFVMFRRIKNLFPARRLPRGAAVSVATEAEERILHASKENTVETPSGSSALGKGRHLTPAQRTGALGEAAAAEHLVAEGHRVVERNWRAGRDEIDLITTDGNCLVFVEVRTRAESALVGGYHSISARKKAALRRVCAAYLKTCHPRPRTYRLDVVQITLGKGGQKVIHHYAGLALFN